MRKTLQAFSALGGEGGVFHKPDLNAALQVSGE